MKTGRSDHEYVDQSRLRRSTRNYLWNYSRKLNVAYIEIPKACCTTIKAAMQSVELGLDPVDLSLAQIHDRQTSPLLNYDQLSAEDITGYRTFTFVRNPYTRIFSAYKDKLVDNQWEKSRRAEDLGFRSDQDIEFLAFLNAIRDQPRHLMDIHWLPQSLILEERQVDYVGRFEQFDNDYYIVAQSLGLPTRVHARQGHATGTGNSVLKRLSREEIDIINSIYIDDFHSLGYLMLD